MQAMAMATFGNGSIASPIVISDDEQDASTVVPNMEYRFAPVPPRRKHSNFESTTTAWQKPPKQTYMDQSMSYAPAGDVTGMSIYFAHSSFMSLCSDTIIPPPPS
jgi:hypothetical protein